jgi:hypothetical protein
VLLMDFDPLTAILSRPNTRLIPLTCKHWQQQT